MDTTLEEIVRLREQAGLRWEDVADSVGLSYHAARNRYRRYKGKRKGVENNEPDHLGFQEEGNHASGALISKGPLTKDEFLEILRVDTEEWEVRAWGSKRWQVGAKIKRGHLSWLDGKIVEGYLDYKGLGKENLWSTWADFIRRKPIQFSPVIQPVSCPTYAPPPHRSKNRTGTAMLLADPHFGYEWNPPSWKLIPFHNRDVLDIFLQIAEDVQPDVIDMLGDTFDLAVWQSRYAIKAGLYLATQPALYEAHRFLHALRIVCPDSEIRIHTGNHDDRIEQCLLEHVRDVYNLKAAFVPELPPVMSLPFLLGLHELQIEWIGNYPNDMAWLGDAMQTQHGHIARSKPLATVTALLENKVASQACGHIHRHEEVEEKRETREGEIYTITGYCPGCACHIDGRVPGSEKNAWSNGIGVIEWYGRSVSINHVTINSRCGVYGGRLYEARDWLAGLKQDLPEWNW